MFLEGMKVGNNFYILTSLSPQTLLYPLILIAEQLHAFVLRICALKKPPQIFPSCPQMFSTSYISNQIHHVVT